MPVVLQIVASYEEQGGPPLHHNGGDGTSASSVGTSSPDIFQSGDGDHNKAYTVNLRDAGCNNDMVITARDLQSGIVVNWVVVNWVVEVDK